MLFRWSLLCVPMTAIFCTATEPAVPAMAARENRLVRITSNYRTNNNHTDLETRTLQLCGFADAVSRVFRRFARRPSSAEENGGRDCYDAFSQLWAEDGDSAEKSKSLKEKQWDVKNVVLAVGAKMILFLPILVVLIGNAVSLSLTALLITTLAIF